MFRLNIKEIATNVALVDTDDDHNWCVPTDRKITCETYVKKHEWQLHAWLPTFPEGSRDFPQADITNGSLTDTQTRLLTPFFLISSTVFKKPGTWSWGDKLIVSKVYNKYRAKSRYLKKFWLRDLKLYSKISFKQI